MNSYELYDKMLTAYKEPYETFNAAARNWVEEADYPNFEDEKANELFVKAKRYSEVWRSNAINSRFSKRQMIECVREIAAKDLPNPYPKGEVLVLGVEPKNVKVEDEPEAIKGATVAEKKEKHVLGVVPEEKPKGLFKRHKE